MSIYEFSNGPSPWIWLLAIAALSLPVDERHILLRPFNIIHKDVRFITGSKALMQ